jgi:hypothetical protein
LDHSVERGVRVTSIMESIDRQLAESAARDAANPTSTPAGDEEDFTGEEEEVEPVSESSDMEDDSEDEAPAKPASFVRRTAPRRSPRDFAARDDED